jgi:hypothetical protein
MPCAAAAAPTTTDPTSVRTQLALTMPATTVRTPTFRATIFATCQRRDPAVARRRRSASAKCELQTKIALVTAPRSSRCTSSQCVSGT